MRTSFVLYKFGGFYYTETPGILICTDAVAMWRNAAPIEPAIRVTLSDTAGVGFRKVVVADRYAKFPAQPEWPTWYLTTRQRKALLELGLMASSVEADPFGRHSPVDGTFYVRISKVKQATPIVT